MTIQPLGFLDTSMFTAMYVSKHKERADNGVLQLRDFKDGEADAVDLPILREWKSGRAILSRVRNAAAAFLDGRVPELGRAWIEIVPPMAGTPWNTESGDYADVHHRTRTCMIGGPGAMSYCGQVSANLLPGIVNFVDLRALSSETNTGEYPRVHLVVDVKIPTDDPEV